MNSIKKQFYKTSAQYFQEKHEMGFQTDYRNPENQMREINEIKKFYIKEGPFINYKEKQ